MLLRMILLACVVVALACGDSAKSLELAGQAGGGNPSENGGSGGSSPGAAGGGAAPVVPQIPDDERPDDPGTVVEPDPVAVPRNLQEQLDEAAALNADSLAAKRAVTFQTDLGYDPMASAGMDLLQASNLSLTADEAALLQRNGFAILARHEFPSFFYAYLTIYGEDLPVYVSADSVLDAVHRSYDDLLANLERAVMVPELRALLASMRAKLAGQSGETAADAELFLAVAQGLLEGETPAPLHAGVDAGEVQAFVDAGEAAAGIMERTLFGVARLIDFSQHKPRGHYEGDPILEPYFRAMMWLGRIDFRMLDTLEDGSQVFQRRQLEAALLLRDLMDEQARARWDHLDAIVSAFVGEHDYMILPELDALLADLRVTDLAGVADDRIVKAIVDGGYGAQRISSQVMINGGSIATLPLARSFAFFGQRYTVDSHVFSNLVFDRVGKGSIPRWLPDPLDAAYAALANDHAVALLKDELARFPYAPDLETMRVLVDDHEPAYWESSLYTLWLSSLRALSPSAENARPGASGLPTVASTEPWARRVVNTQLGSWSQLRHDTLLYVKQSYTTGTVCEFPDAYVDPYPELFAALGRFAERGRELIAQLPSVDDPTTMYLFDSAQLYFEGLGEVMTTLQEMAQAQRTGMPHSAEHLAFINDVVQVQGGGSGPPSVDGWYTRLFLNPLRALEQDPIIADVHTDVGGNERPPKVLHVATGLPRAMVVTIDTCVGPRAYVGPVFAYHEQAPDGLNRITDSEWAEQIMSSRPDDVRFMTDLIAR
jgi:hypothetical protein